VTRKLALITGASAGIGAALARVYAREGYDLALTARRRDRLDALAADMKNAHGAETIVIAADLADPGTVDAILAAIAAKGRAVDVLVNNAGYGQPGTWLGTRWEDQARVLQVMLTAPLELAHKVLPGMAERKWGRILNIASLAGFSPGSRGHTTYGAIKAALIRFSQSLHVEMEGTGVQCTALCPGLTWSEFHDVNGTRPYLGRVPGWLWQSAEKVADIGYRAVEQNRSVVVTGVPNKLIAGLAKLTPDAWALHLTKGIGARYGKMGETSGEKLAERSAEEA
jgi:short-subunit dehydrogenase